MARCGIAITAWFILSLQFLPCEAGADDSLKIRASGVGYSPAYLAGTPRGRLMAERAAKIVATRNLIGAPGIGGFRAYVPGVKVVRTRPTWGFGMEAIVEMTIPMWHVRETIIQW